MRNLITICARGGSKGIPGKNIKELNGKPLIYYTIKVAELFANKFPATDILLSTDSQGIKKIVKELSDKVVCSYERPDFLATDTSGKIDVIKDALNFAENHFDVEYEFIMDLDVTSPLRTLNDLIKAHTELNNHQDALNIFSVNEANRNPYFNMVEKTSNSKFVRLSKEGNFLTRQTAPKVYDMNASFYIYRKTFFDKDYRTPITERSLIYNTPHLCFDLDHPIDFTFMEFLIQNDLLDFDLAL